MRFFAIKQIWVGKTGEALASLGKRAATYEDLNDLIAAIKTATRPGDHVVVMSNGAFGDIHERLLEVMNSAVAGFLRCGAPTGSDG